MQFPSPAYFPKQTFTFLVLADKGNGGSVLIQLTIFENTHHGRQFLTKEEKLKKLAEYKNWLDNESKGVE